MTRYVCFLRGINVGGSKVIKMEHLRKIFESLKLKNVSTFIQSGNVLFDSPQTDFTKLITKIERGLFKSLGYQVESAVRDIDTLKAVVKKNPFSRTNLGEKDRVYVTFLNENPLPDKSKTLESFSYDAETVKVKGKEIYILVDKIRTGTRPLFTNNFIEKKLGLRGTSRDLNTLTKILNLE